MMLKGKGAVKSYTEKGRIWIEIKWGVKNLKRGLKTRLIGV